MSYQFESVELLSYEHKPILMQNGGYYKVEKHLTINGVLTDLSNYYGISGILAGQENLLLGAQDYQPVSLNGVIFGSGKVNSIKFQDGLLIQTDKYTFDLTIYSSGNLFNILSGAYSGIVWDQNTYLIDTFDENLSYSQEADLSKIYNHSINIRYNAQFPPLSGINLAVLFARNMFNSESGIYPFLGQYQNLGTYKHLYTETYDMISSQCGFSAATKILPNNAGGYSYTLAYKLDLNPDGYTTITEDCLVQGQYNPRIQFAESGYNNLITGSYGRASGVYSIYDFSTIPLFTGAIEQGVNKNNRDGTINFRNTFSNNPKYTGIAIWTYDDSLSQSQEGYITVEEKGNIVGYGRPAINKYQNAYLFYENYVVPTIANRLGTIYSGYTSYPKTLLAIANSNTQNQFVGVIDYSSTMTDNNTFVNISGIKTAIMDISISKPTHLFANFSVVDEFELVQDQFQNTQGDISVNIKARGARGLPLNSYITYASSFSNQFASWGADNYLDKARWSLSPITNDFNFNCNFKFLSGYKSASDLNLD